MRRFCTHFLYLLTHQHSHTVTLIQKAFYFLYNTYYLAREREREKTKKCEVGKNYSHMTRYSWNQHVRSFALNFLFFFHLLKIYNLFISASSSSSFWYFFSLPKNNYLSPGMQAKHTRTWTWMSRHIFLTL